MRRPSTLRKTPSNSRARIARGSPTRKRELTGTDFRAGNVNAWLSPTNLPGRYEPNRVVVSGAERPIQREGRDARNDPSNDLDFAADRCVAAMGLQHRVGVLPERRDRACGLDPCHSFAARVRLARIIHEALEAAVLQRD